jgi:hypothetical protein
MAGANTSRHPVDDPADAAIAHVLRAETEALAAIAACQADADRLAESGRALARALAERTERRIRRIVAAFERERAARLAEIDAEIGHFDQAPDLAGAEAARLDRAVTALAQALTEGPP